MSGGHSEPRAKGQSVKAMPDPVLTTIAPNLMWNRVNSVTKTAKRNRPRETVCVASGDAVGVVVTAIKAAG